jgi:hypothetical protein
MMMFVVFVLKFYKEVIYDVALFQIMRLKMVKITGMQGMGGAIGMQGMGGATGMQGMGGATGMQGMVKI